MRNPTISTRQSPVSPAGEGRSLWRATLEAGASLLQDGDRVPLGDPKLMWSFNRDGEADERLKRNFESSMGVDEAQKRAQRASLTARAHPQRGVDTLRDAFPGATPLAGVEERAGA